MVNKLDKNILKLGFHVKMGATKYKTQNQVQIFCMINKCIEDFEVRLRTHLDHLLIIEWI